MIPDDLTSIPREPGSTGDAHGAADGRRGRGDGGAIDVTTTERAGAR